MNLNDFFQNELTELILQSLVIFYENFISFQI